MERPVMYIVSKCLAGEPCRYDGKDNLVPEIRTLVERGEAVAVCPEALGGLPTPRTPSEIQPDGRILNKRGEDVTEAFVRGAERATAICREHGCTGAILKARSPSCGKGVIYDGSFTGTCAAGNGVFAQQLLDAGIPVMTEEEYLKKREWIIHAVGPNFSVTPKAFKELFNACYNSLVVLMENGYHSISFPLISSGIFGGSLADPAGESAKQCLRAYRKFVADHPDYDVDVTLCAFSASEMASAEEALKIDK